MIRSCHVEDEENEEERIDKFFTLIKSIREARDRLMQDSEVLKESENKRKKKVVKEENQKHVWKPSFQLEDFMEDIHHQHHRYYFNTSRVMSLVSPSSSQIDPLQGSQEDKTEGLDLSLSL